MSQAELRRLTNMIKDTRFRVKVRSFFQRSIMKIEKEKHGLTFFKSPAGKYHHHSYVGGLLQHTISTTRIALMLADTLVKSYGWKHVNRDYVVAEAILHDLFKPVTYRVGQDGTFDYSPLGEKLDHLSILLGEAYPEDFPPDFIHVLAAGHGDAGPISPHTIEALIVHLADLVDSRLVGDIQKAAYRIVRKCTGEANILMSPKEALDVIYAKQVDGCGTVAVLTKRIRKKRFQKM